MRWGGRWEEGSGWRTFVNPWLIHVNVWQKPLQYCKVISLQLIKINQKKKKKSPLGEKKKSPLGCAHIASERTSAYQRTYPSKKLTWMPKNQQWAWIQILIYGFSLNIQSAWNFPNHQTVIFILHHLCQTLFTVTSLC